MKRAHLLLTLGILVLLSPFVGLPYTFLMFLLPVLGLLIILATVLRIPKRAPTHDATEAS